MKKISRGEHRYSFLTVICCQKARCALMTLCLVFMSSLMCTLRAQNSNLNLQYHSVMLKEVLQAIEKQTSYVFFYNNSDIDVNKVVSIDVSNATITEVLNKVLAGYDYSIKENKILLFPKGKTQTIKGKVTDDKGEAIIGANVRVADTSIGTITNIDGEYSVEAPLGSSLQFTYIGFQPVTQVARTPTLNVKMAEDSKMLEEVVVTGYGGTQLRSKVTSSISKMDAEVLQKGVRANPAQAMAGTIPGIRVIQSTGKPSATPDIILRGGTELDGSGNALVVVDGQVRNISDVNPQDIESMDVLKDAAATALYGARANNGVILITTKRGEKGKPRINVNTKVGINFINFPYDFLDGEDYLYWARMGVKNAADSGITTLGSLKTACAYGTGNQHFDSNGNRLDGNKVSSAIWTPMVYDNSPQHNGLLKEGWKLMKDPVYGDQIIYRNYDMQKEAFNDPSYTQDYNVSISGGSDKGNYYAGFGYYKEEGLPKKTYYDRLSFLLNADYKIKDFITSYSSFSYQKAKWYDSVIADDEFYFGYITGVPPTMVGTNADGEPVVGENPICDTNPSANMDAYIRDNNSNKFTMGQSFKFDIIKNLWVKVGANWLYEDIYNEGMNRDTKGNNGAIYTGRRSYANTQNSLSQTYTVTANYDFSLAKNNFNILAGAEYYYNKIKGFSAEGSGAPTDDFLNLGLTSTDAGKRKIASWHSEEAILSSFGRINYDYDGRYLLSFIFREDGYSRLVNNRWGFFPGVSAGWNISREKFMEGTKDVISFLKLRASYGLNGNISKVGKAENPNERDNVYELQGIYGNNLYSGNTGFYIQKVPNPNLRWEKSHTFEVAADLGLLENRINLSLTYYNRKTQDKIAEINLPVSSGVATILTNNGSLRNQGLEFDAKFKVLQTKDFKWNLAVNGGFNKNKILQLPDNGLERNRQDAVQVYDPSTGNTIWVGGYQEGKTPGDLYVFQMEGIYQSEDDIKNYGVELDKQGKKPLVPKYIYDALPDNEKDKYFKIEPGDAKWKDVNRDGVIDEKDKVYVGTSLPKFVGGLNTNLSWKGLSLFARMDFALGHTQVDVMKPWIMGMEQGEFNNIKEIKDSWTPENPGAKYPKHYWASALGKTNYTRQSSLFAYKANYLAFREVTLSYQLPSKWLQNCKIENVNVSITGQNLGYWTSSQCYSPEKGGVVSGGYSLPRTLAFSVNLSL